MAEWEKECIKKIKNQKSKINPSTTLRVDGERPSTPLGTGPEFIEGRSRTIKNYEEKEGTSLKKGKSPFVLIIMILLVTTPLYGNETIEQHFKTRSRAYFNVSFDGERDPELVWDVIDILNDARHKIKGDFRFFTDQEISVIIYNKEQFKKAISADSQRLDWTFGVYDGKIRLKVSDIMPVQEDTRRVIYHEYGHAVLHILYPNNIPPWLHEGFAQLAEPASSAINDEENVLKEFFKKHEKFNLSQIDRLFESSNYNQAREAYIVSKFFLKYLIDRYGIRKFKSLLEKLSAETALEEAMYDTYRLHIKDITDGFKNFVLT